MWFVFNLLIFSVCLCCGHNFVRKCITFKFSFAVEGFQRGSAVACNLQGKSQRVEPASMTLNPNCLQRNLHNFVVGSSALTALNCRCFRAFFLLECNAYLMNIYAHTHTHTHKKPVLNIEHVMQYLKVLRCSRVEPKLCSRWKASGGLDLFNSANRVCCNTEIPKQKNSSTTKITGYYIIHMYIYKYVYDSVP